MIKVNSAARVLIGLACVTAAGMSVTGCSTTAQAAGNTAGPSQSTTTTQSSAPAGTTASTNPGTSSAPQGQTPSQSAANGSNGGQANGSSRCHTSELSASFTVVANSAGAGNISYNLRLTNTSMHQCTIYGYAGMLLLGANHDPLPTHVIRDTLVPRQLPRINPGGSVAATVRLSPDVPGPGDNGPAAPGQTWVCQPTSYYTEVTPPDETTQLVTAVSPPTPVCSSGTMQISAFVAGPTGPNQS
jgi:hypothetical protein